MKHTYFNRYPLTTKSFEFYTDQTVAKNAIKDFNQGMLDAGLVRSSDNNQLDVDNIPDLELLQSLNINKSTNYSYLYDGTYTKFQPLVYMFTDDKQETLPIYIKIEFLFGRMLAYVASHPEGVTQRYPVGLFAQISVGTRTDGNSNLIGNGKCSEFTGTYQTSGSNNISYTMIYDASYKQNSMINYIPSKGILNVNVCPTIRLAGGEYNNSYINNINYNYNFSLVRFFIVRQEDHYIVGIPKSGYATSNYNGQKMAVYFINNDNYYLDDAVDMAKVNLQTSNNFENGKLLLNMATSINPTTKRIYSTPYILIGNTNILTNNSFGEYNVEINDNEKYKYLTFSPMDSGFYVRSTNRSETLLIYNGD